MSFSSLKVKIFTGIAVPLLAMLGLGILSFLRIEGLQDTSKWVNHTYKVMAEAELIVTNAVDMETGMRGYLLAGKDEFLQPYHSGSQVTYARMTQLKATVSDNPAQVKRLEEAEKILRHWQELVAEKNIALRRDIGDAQTMNDVSRWVQQGQGKSYFDKFRQQIAVFIEREDQLLVERHQASLATLQSMRDNLQTEGQFDTLLNNRHWVTHTYQVMQQATDILASAVDMETGMRGYLLAGREHFLEPYEKGAKHFFELTTQLKETVSDNPAQVALLSDIEEVIREWQAKVVLPKLQLRRDMGDAKTMDDIADLIAQAEGKVFFDQFRAVMRVFVDTEQVLVAQRQQANTENVANTQFIIIAALITALIIAAGVGVYVTLGILKQVGGEPATISKIAAQVAKGRLDQNFNTHATGIYAALKSMTLQLRDTVENVREAAEAVASNSEQMSTASQTLSQGAAEQAASLEETSSSMEELATNTQQNTENAQKTQTMATQAASNAEEGQKTVEQAVGALKQIANKITVVEDISSRINLLALNATIESARAGEHGRGFAVVASEVRKLAEHSQVASKDIGEISASSLVFGENAGQRIDLMVSSFDETSTLVQEIVAASNEQGCGIEQVNQALQQLEQVTQRNAGAAEEMSGSAQELSSRAMQLKQTMEFFKL